MSSLQNNKIKNNKNEEMRLRFLKMAKQFNWNRAHISNNTQPSPHHQTNASFVPSNPQINLPQNTITTSTRSTNHSIIDSEETESESSHNKHDPPNIDHNHRQTILANNKNKIMPSPCHNNSDGQIINLHTKTLNLHDLQHSDSLMLPSKPLQNRSNTNLNISSLTEENLNKFTLSFSNKNNNNKIKENINKTNPLTSPSPPPSPSKSSVSSVLSKHNFTLLEISSSDQEEEDELDIPSKAEIKNNSILSDLQMEEIKDDEDEMDQIKYLSNKTINNNQYETKYFRGLPSNTKNDKLFGGAFLDLCSSESDSEDDNVDGSSLFKRIMEKKKKKNIEFYPNDSMIKKPTEIIPKTISKDKKNKNKYKNRNNQNILSASYVGNITNLDTKILCDISISFKQFKKQRDDYTSLFFERLNVSAFGNKMKLNINTTYSWCNTLNKTAGDCRLFTRNKIRMAHIRLATKVLDNLEKLKQTFCHEMCHAMAWIVHSNRKPPHGQHFKYWAHKAELAFDDIKVTTCHNYKIQYKFQWECVDCKYIYGRHSKSIKIDSHRCGVCRGKLQFLGRLKPDGTFAKQIKKRAPTKFNIFMKENMGKIKQQFPAAKHGEIMRILSERYKMMK